MRNLLLTYAVIGIILSAHIAQCQSRSHVLSQLEFSKFYQDSLSRRIPGAKFTQLDDRTFTMQVDSSTIRVAIDNAYTEYTGTPDSLPAILRRYIASVLEATRRTKVVNTRDNLIPMVKPASFLDELKGMEIQMGTKKETEYVYEKYNSELIIIYAFNTETNIEYLTSKDLPKLNLPKDSLRPVAIRNLVNILPDIQPRGNTGIYIVTAGGNFEAELILMDRMWEKKMMPVKGDYIISIPTRDLLLVTGSDDKPNLDKLRSVTKKTFADGDHAVSDKLYRWDGKKFVVFE